MFTSYGLRKNKCFLENDKINIDGVLHAIENINEIDDDGSRWVLVSVLSIQTIVVFSIVAYMIYRDKIANLSTPDYGAIATLIFLLIICLAPIGLVYGGIQSKRKYRSKWIYNDTKMLLIEQIDLPDIENKLKELKRAIASSTSARPIKCPHCHLKTPVLLSGLHSCRQCKTRFTVMHDYELSDIKEPSYYLLIMVLSFIAFLAYAFLLSDRLSPYLGKEFFLVPLLLFFGSFIAKALHHGVLWTKYGNDIYRADMPNMFLAGLIMFICLEFFLLYIYIDMQFFS